MTTPALALDKLAVTIDGRTIVQATSLTLAPAQLVAIVGPNGAGKTTLLKAIAGLLPHAGSLTIEGHDSRTLGRQDRARRIGYLPQGHQVHWPIAARDLVALGRFPHGAVDPARLSSRDAEIVHRAMAMTGTLALADQPGTTLSGGERARVMLARVLAVEARILLADEPTASLDPHHQLGVMESLRAEAQQGALVVAVTHDLTLAARMADRIILMAEGRVTAFGAPAAVLSDAQLAETYGIRALRLEAEGETALVPWARMPGPDGGQP